MNQQRQSRPICTVLHLAFLMVISFYAGYRSKNNANIEMDRNINPLHNLQDCNNYNEIIKRINADVNNRQLLLDSATKIQNLDQTRKQHPNKDPSFIQAMARLSKQELMSEFDNFGVATLESPLLTDDEALLIYNHADAIPDKLLHSQESTMGDDYNNILLPRVDNVTEALEKCDSLNVQFTHSPVGFHPQCHLWIPVAQNLPAFHVDRWMRLSDDDSTIMKLFNKFDHNAPLRHVGSITTPTGVNKFDLPKFKPLISGHWKALLRFLENADEVLEEIRKLLNDNGIDKPLTANTTNAITVMTVNYGQLDLLINFFCAAKARGLDLHRVLVFVTDEESKLLVESFSKDLRVMVYHDKGNFALMPKGGEDEKYGDATFTSMMFAKILCVLYVSMSGYDVLYQDVDIVFYRNPLEFFRDYGSGSQDYDIIFQHDGSSQPRYAPYSGNSGFVYARANEKVQYLFTSLLYHGDLIRKTHSHQQLLNQLLLEHSSLFGLKVKVLDRHDYDQFPGGYHFNHDHSTMHRIISGELKPYIFHMFFTDGKQTKVKYLKQFGEWYVQDECVAKFAFGNENNCCSAQPLISCYYKDKPSVIPCNESPSYEKNGESFWKQ